MHIEKSLWEDRKEFTIKENESKKVKKHLKIPCISFLRHYALKTLFYPDCHCPSLKLSKN